MYNSCFLAYKCPAQSATIYPSALVILFDGVVVLFRINYCHPEVSCITKAKAVWTGAARFRPLSHFSWHLSAPPLSRSTIAQLPRPPPFSPTFQSASTGKQVGKVTVNNAGVTVAPRITMVMPKQCLTAKPNTKFESQQTLTQLPTPFPLLSHKKVPPCPQHATPTSPHSWPFKQGHPHS